MKKSVLSIAMALIIATIMSLGCFATEANWGFNQTDSMLYNTIELASITRQYSYASYSMALECSISLQPKAISDIMTRVYSDFYIRKLNVNYSDALAFYASSGSSLSFDQYMLNMVSSLSYTSIDNIYHNYTTDTIIIEDMRYITNRNEIYWYYSINKAKYNGSSYYFKQLNQSVLFATELYTGQPHFYY